MAIFANDSETLLPKETLGAQSSPLVPAGSNAMIGRPGGRGISAVSYLVAAVLVVAPVISIAQQTLAPPDKSSTTLRQGQSTAPGADQPNSNNPSTSSGQDQPELQIYIQEYRVEGT